ncbi:MAG: hypothetical protein J5590_03390 [Clostridia bacterium]|nr:hypothetical protein [Clostridia bacterium]
MSVIGKIHEISLYGLLTSIVCMALGKLGIKDLLDSFAVPGNFGMLFMSYLFWASVLFIPISIIGAFATKYSDGGEGLSFYSDNILVIMFAHIAEDILGLVLTPFWFLKDLFSKDLSKWKIIDYSTYLLELIFIAVGLHTAL